MRILNLIGIVLILATIHITRPKLHFELATAQGNVYYIDHLTVTEESTALNLTFRNHSELSDWIKEMSYKEATISDYDVQSLINGAHIITTPSGEVSLWLYNAYSDNVWSDTMNTIDTIEWGNLLYYITD